MKRAYVRPTMVGERFVANEYVAACGDSGVVYKFDCNAGEKGRRYAVKDAMARLPELQVAIWMEFWVIIILVEKNMKQNLIRDF